MPTEGMTLNPGTGGPNLGVWSDPNTQRKDQHVRLMVNRGGILYVASTDMITFTATASLQVWGFFNPAASGLNAWFRRIYCETYANAAASTINLRLVRTSNVVTTGTAVTATRPDGVAAASAMTNRSLPGTTATATAGNISSILTPTTAGGILSKELHNSAGFMNRDIMVAPGTGLLLVANGTPTTAQRAIVDALWEEVA